MLALTLSGTVVPPYHGVKYSKADRTWVLELWHIWVAAAAAKLKLADPKATA